MEKGKPETILHASSAYFPAESSTLTEGHTPKVAGQAFLYSEKRLHQWRFWLRPLKTGPKLSPLRLHGSFLNSEPSTRARTSSTDRISGVSIELLLSRIIRMEGSVRE